MAISFGGLASGVDTSSWIEALVSMKQTSVKAYEEKKEILIATTNVLENVKSFFTSFKNVLTNVTNANLGIPSFDLFIQNLVETTNAEVATATVTTEAQEASYEVYVDQVATATEAQSTYLTTLSTTTESIATHNSLLSSIGIGTGQVGINVGGAQRIITLQSNDTIGSLIQKLNQIGVDSSYDAQFGYFSVNLGLEDINDDLDGDGIDNTGIKQALFLTNVNSGYASEILNLFSTYTDVITATEHCKMSDFGVENGEYIITDSNGDFTVHNFDVDKTFGEFFEELRQYGLNAEFTEDGCIVMEAVGGNLLSGQLAEDLGLVTVDNSRQTTTTASSTISAYSTETLTVDFTSSLGDIGVIKNSSDELVILDQQNNTIQVINTLTQDSTIDDLFEVLAHYNISGSLVNSVVTLESMSGNVIGGSIAENLGIETFLESTTTLKAGGSTTSTTMVSYVASATDWVSDCLWDVWDSYTDADKVLTVSHTDRYGTDQVYTFTIVEKNSIGSDGSVLKGTQFQDIINWYNELDSTSTMVFNDNGQIYIDSNDCFYFEGTVAEYLGLRTYATTYTWTEGITTTQSSGSVSFRIRSTDQIADALWDNGWQNYTDSQKVISAYKTVVDHTNDGDNDATFQHTVVTLVGTFTVQEHQTETIGAGMTLGAGSTILSSEGTEVVLDAETVTSATTTVVVGHGTTFEELTEWFTTQIDTTATFTINSDGTITIDSDDTYKLEGQVMTDLGLGVSTYHQVWTTGIEKTESSQGIVYVSKMTDYISDTFTMNGWNGVNKVLSIYNTTVDHVNGADGNSTYQVTVQTKLTDITIDYNMTFNGLAERLQPYGISLTMDNGVIRLNGTGSNYIVEENLSSSTSMLSHFGISYDTLHQTWTTGIITTESTDDVHYKSRLTDYISDSFRKSEWESLSNSAKQIVIYHTYWDHDSHHSVIEEATRTTINEYTTWGDLQSFLAPYITMDMSNRVITLDSDCYFVAGADTDLSTIGTASAKEADGSFYTGALLDHFRTTEFGVNYNTLTQNWTTGTSMTNSNDKVYYETEKDDLVKDCFTSGDWANINKTFTVKNMSYNYETHSTVTNTVGSFTIDSTTTIRQLENMLSNYGISCDIVMGVVTMDSDGNWVEGPLAQALGFSTNTIRLTSTIGKSATSTATVRNTIHATDTLNNPLYGNWNSLDKTLNIYQSTMAIDTTTGQAYEKDILLGSYTVTENTKFNDIKAWAQQYSIGITMTDGVISVSVPDQSTYMTGDIASALGVSITSGKVDTYTVGITQTSGTMSYSTHMSDYVVDTDSSLLNQNINIVEEHLVNGVIQPVTIATMQINSNTTFQDIADWAANYEVTLTCNLGQFAATAAEGYNRYIDGAFKAVADIVTVNAGEEQWTMGATSTTATLITFNASMNDRIKDTLYDVDWSNLNKQIKIEHQTYDVQNRTTTNTVRGTITVDDNTTFQSLANQLSSYGITLNMTNGTLVISSSDTRDIATGAIIDALGMNPNASPTTRDVTIGVSATGSNTLNAMALESSKCSDYGFSDSIVIKKWNAVTGEGTAVATITPTGSNTFGDIIDQVETATEGNFAGAVSNGVLSFTIANGKTGDGYYIEGMANGGGVSTGTTTETITPGAYIYSATLSYISTDIQEGSGSGGVREIIIQNSSTITYNIEPTITGTTATSGTVETPDDIISAAASKTFAVAVDQVTSFDGATYVRDGVTYTVVGTAADLQTALNNNENVILSSDIDMTGVDWQIVDRYRNNFDGNGHVISNLTIISDEQYIGLFGETGPQFGSSQGSISNLGIVNATISGLHDRSGCIGAIAGRSNSSINNCYVSDSQITGGRDTGGVAGLAYGNCSNISVYDTTINSRGDDLGGIAGMMSSDTTNINLNVYNSTITTTNTAAGSTNLGGIAGYASCSFENVNVYCIQISGYGDGIGGIVGEHQFNRNETNTIPATYSNINVYNANIETRAYDGAGGIVGHLYANDGIMLENCNVNATFSSSSSNVGKFVGVIVPYSGTQCTVLSSCTYASSMSSSTKAIGGLAKINGNTTLRQLGFTQNKGYVTIYNAATDSYSTATIDIDTRICFFGNPIETASLNEIKVKTSGANITIIETTTNYIVGISEELANLLHIEVVGVEPEGVERTLSNNGVIYVDVTNTTASSATVATPTSVKNAATSQTFAVAVNRVTNFSGDTYVRDGVTYTVVGTAADLQSAISAKKNIILSNDIDLTGVNWTVVNGYNRKFDGNGHVISNLSLSDSGSGTSYYGLFGSLKANCTISNLGLTNFNIDVTRDGAFVGCLAGYIDGVNVDSCAVTNCYVSNSELNVTKKSNSGNKGAIGGLIGDAGIIDISNCNVYNTTIDTQGEYHNSNWDIGGIVGIVDSLAVLNNTNVYNVSISVGEMASAGGITGEVYGGKISNSDVYRVTIVSDTTTEGSGRGCGGVVGATSTTNPSCKVTNVNVYQTSITSGDYVGGLIGYADTYTTIGSVFTSCNVDATISSPNSGNLVGYFTASASHNVSLFDSCSYNSTMNGSVIGTKYTTVKVSDTTKLSNFGVTGTNYITVHDSGTNSNKVVTITSSMTMKNVASVLSASSSGITATSTSGGFTIHQTTTDYLVGMTDELANFLHLNVGEGYTYSMGGGIEVVESTIFLDGTSWDSATAGQFGLNSTTVTLEKYVDDGKGGIQKVTKDVDLSSDQTLAEWASILSAESDGNIILDCSYLYEGAAKIEQTVTDGSAYTLADTDIFGSYSDTQNTASSHQQTFYTYSGGNSASSNQCQHVATGSSTLEEVGLDGNVSFSIIHTAPDANGDTTVLTQTLSNTTTLTELLSYLNSSTSDVTASFNNGQLTIQGNGGYVTLSENLSNLFGVTEGNLQQVVTYTTYQNTTDVTGNLTALNDSESCTLQRLGVTQNVNYIVTTHQDAQHGSVVTTQTVTWSVNQSMTSFLNNLRTALQAASCTISNADPDVPDELKNPANLTSVTFDQATRTVTIKGDNEHYIQEYGSTIENGTVFDPLQIGNTLDFTTYHYQQYLNTELLNSKFSSIQPSLVGTKVDIYEQHMEPDQQQIITSVISSYTIGNDTTVQDVIDWADIHGVQILAQGNGFKVSSPDYIYLVGAATDFLTAQSAGDYVSWTYGVTVTSAQAVTFDTQMNNKIFDVYSNPTRTLVVKQNQFDYEHGQAVQTAVGTITINETTTFADLRDMLANGTYNVTQTVYNNEGQAVQQTFTYNYGINMTLLNGVMLFTSDNNTFVDGGANSVVGEYVDGDVKTYTVVNTVRSSDTIVATAIAAATLGNYNLNGQTIEVDFYDSITGTSSVVGSFTTSASDTFQDLIDRVSTISGGHIQGSMNDGKICFTYADGYYVKQNNAFDFGTFNTETRTVTIGSTNTTGDITYYKTVITGNTTVGSVLAASPATLDSKLGDYGISSSDIVVKFHDVMDGDSIVGTVQTSGTTTFQDLADQLSSTSNGNITITMTNGELKFHYANGYFLESATEDWGVDGTYNTTEQTITIGAYGTSSDVYYNIDNSTGKSLDGAVLTYTQGGQTRTATASTTLDQLGFQGLRLSFRDNSTLQLQSNLSLSEVVSYVNSNSGGKVTMSFSDGHLSLTTSGNVFSDITSLVTLGFSDDESDYYDGEIVKTYLSSSDWSSKSLSEMNMNVANGNFVIYTNTRQNGTVEAGQTAATITISNSDTFADIASRLSNYGINLTLSGSQISLQSTDTNYYCGNIFNAITFNQDGSSSYDVTTTEINNFDSTTVAAPAALSRPIDENSTLKDLDINSFSLDFIAGVTNAPTFDGNATLSEVFAAINTASDGKVTASIANSQISITLADGDRYIVNTNTFDKLGLSTDVNDYYNVDISLNGLDDDAFENYTLQELGISGIIIDGYNNNNSYENGRIKRDSVALPYSDTMTFAQWAEALAEYDIVLSRVDNHIQIQSNGNYYVDDCFVDATQNGVSIKGQYNPNQVEVALFSTTNIETNQFSNTAQASTKLAELGITEDGTIFGCTRLLANGEEGASVNINAQASGSIQDLINTLNAAGMQASFSNGIFTMGGTNTIISRVFNADAAGALNLSADAEDYRGSVTAQLKVNGGQTNMKTNMTEEYTLRDMGYSQAVNVNIIHHTSTFNEEKTSMSLVTWDLDETLGSFLNDIRNASDEDPLSVSFSNGRVTIDGNSMTYMANPIEPLNITSGTFNSWGGMGRTSQSTIEHLWTNFTNRTDLNDLTLVDFEVYTDQNVTVVQYDAATNTYSSSNLVWHTNDSLASFFYQLNAAGIETSATNGTIKFMGDSTAYISEMSSGLSQITSMTAGNGGSYNTHNITYRQATTDGQTKYFTLHGSNTLADFDINSSKTITFVCHTNNTFAQDCTTPNGDPITGTNKTVVMTWTTGQTLNEFITQLNNSELATNYGCSFSYDESVGKVTFNGSNTAYIQTMDTALKDMLRMSGSYYTTSTYDLTCEADSTKTNLATYINKDTMLNDFGITTNQTIDIVCHINNTYVADNTKATGCTATISVTWTTGDTLERFAQKVNNAMANASTLYAGNDTGPYSMTIAFNEATRKFEFTGNEYTYIGRIDSQLASALKVSKREGNSYGTSYAYTIINRANADENAEYTYMNERNTKLSNFTITTDQTIDYVVHTHNTYVQRGTDAAINTYTLSIAWTTGETLGAYEAKVNQELNRLYNRIGVPKNVDGTYNVSFSVDQENGKISFTGNEYTYVGRIDSALENVWHVSANSTGSYGTDKKVDGSRYDYTVIYRPDADDNKEYTYINTRRTALANLSISSDQTIDIVVHVSNTYAQDTTKSATGQRIASGDGAVYTTSTIALTQSSASAIVYGSPELANSYTTFEQLGINTEHAVNVYNSNGELLGDFSMTQSSTLGDFLSQINRLNRNAHASLNNGVISISDGYITGGIASALELNTYNLTITTGTTQTSSNSIIVNSSTVIATATNTLAEVGINSPDTVHVYDTDGTELGSFNLTSSSTLGDLVASINAANTSANARLTNGAITMENCYLSGNVATALGLTNSNISGNTTAVSQTSATAVTYNTTSLATATNTLSEIGINSPDTVHVYNSDGTEVGSFNLTSSSTLGDLVASINAANTNANATLTNGIISMENCYLSGNVATALGLNNNGNGGTYTVTTSETQTSASGVNYISTNLAAATNTLAEIGINSPDTVHVYDSNGTEVGSFNLTSSSTLGDLVASINAANTNANATLTNGVISMENCYLSGNVATTLGLTVDGSNIQTITTSATQTSASGITYNTTVTATGNTTFGDLGIDTNSGEITVYDENGNVQGSFTVSQSTTTLDQFINSINAQNTNANAVLSNGVISIENGYITGALAEAIGINCVAGSELTPPSGFNQEVNQISLTDSIYVEGTTTYTVVGTAAELQTALNANQNVILSSDIDMTGVNWQIVNNYSSNFNGNGHIISNLTITSDERYVGLFGYLGKNSSISNLGMENITINSSSTSYASSAGGLVGTDNEYANTINNCYISNSNIEFTGTKSGVVGGLIGEGTKTYIDNSNVYNVSVSGRSYVGGLAGQVTYVNNSNVYNATVSGDMDNIGGLVGYAYRSNIYNSNVYNATVSGTSTSTRNVGGLVGGVTPGTNISNCNVKAAIFNTDQSTGKIVGSALGQSSEGTYTLLTSCTYDSSMTSPTNVVGQVLGTQYVLATTAASGTVISPDSIHSNALSQTITNTFTDSTTLANLGLNSASFTTNNGTVNLTSGDNIVSKLQQAGLTVNVSNDGKISISGDSNHVLTGMSSELQSALNISVGEGSTYNVQEVANSSISSPAMNASVQTRLNNETTLSDLGLNSASFTTNNGTVNLTSGDNIVSALQQAGLTVNVNNDGKITISGDSSHILTGMSSELQSALNISVGEGSTYTVQEVANSSISSSAMNASVQTRLNNETTLSDLGLNSASFTTNNGTVNLTSGDNIVSALQQAGLTVSVNNNGKITISGNSNHILTGMSSELQSALNISVGEGSTYNVEAIENAPITSSVMNVSAQVKMNNGTTLADLGLSSASFTTNKGTVRLTSGDNIVDKFENAGLDAEVNDGKITIIGNDNTYITDMSSNLKNALQISTGYHNTYTKSTTPSNSSTDSKVLYASDYETLSASTTFGDIGVGSGSFTLDDGSTINVSSYDNILSTFQNAGLNAVVYNGVLSVTGDDDNFITSMSDNLQEALRIQVGENYSYREIVGTDHLEGDFSAVTRTITVTWTYGALGTSDNDAQPENLGQFISDINASLRIATTEYSYLNLEDAFKLSVYIDGEGKINFTGNEYTYVNRISPELQSALFLDSVTKENGSFGTSYSYNIDYANNSNNQVQSSFVNYNNTRLQNFDIYESQYVTIVTNNNTTFAADTTKNSTVLFENTSSTYVIEWTAGTTGNINGYNQDDNGVRDGETFESFIYELEHFGVLHNLDTEASRTLGNDIYKINVTINPDKTISLVGNEYTYILGISDALQDSFKISNQVGEGSYYSTYDYDLHFTGAEKNAQNSAAYGPRNYDIEFTDDAYSEQNTTLLNYDTRLNNLSILSNMTMTLETPEGGKSIEIDPDETIQQVKERLFNDYGIEVTVGDKDGLLTFTPTRADEGYYIVGLDTEFKDKFHIITGENGEYTIDSEYTYETATPGVYQTAHHTVTAEHGTYETSVIDNYANTASRNLEYTDDHITAKMDTRISRLNGYNGGNGDITVHYADGTEQNISIRSSMTIGQLCDVLQDYGVTAKVLAGGRMTFSSEDGTYLKSAEGGSNLLDILNMSDFNVTVEGNTVITSKTLLNTVVSTSTYFASEDTLLSEYAEGLLEANGVITFLLNDRYKSVTITSDDTFGTLINKFTEKGLKSKLEAGVFSVSSGFDTFSIVQEATTSNLSAIIKFNEKTDLGGYAMTDRSRTIIATTTLTETKSISVANFADEDTTFDTFKILPGSLSVYRDGERALVHISGSDSARTLQNKLREAYGQDINGSDDECINVKYVDGIMKVYQNGSKIVVGSNADNDPTKQETSNFSAITGIMSDESGSASSTRRFYKVNENSVVTESGLFRNGDVTTGSFVIGDATVTIDETTTIGNIVSQINTNPNSNVTAYWDGIDGELVIKSKTTGDFYINVEAGDTNFTDIMGLTKSSYDANTGNTTTTINIDSQKNGKNARITINGASYTSTSNTLGSDVTGIEGLTINLKGMSKDSSTVLTVKKDVQSLALAVGEVVDAYNALIDNINSALMSKSDLQNDSDLKRLRNQIKSIMTNSYKNSSPYKNIVAIGIVTNAADPTNLTVGSGLYKLSLDVEKFAKAFEADADGVRTLLIGRVDENGEVLEEGVLTQIEALIDDALDSASGYFERTEESFDNQINRLDNKIVKGNAAIEKYREKLEKKYMSMNILNGNIQTQYQVYFK